MIVVPVAVAAVAVAGHMGAVNIKTGLTKGV